MFNFLLAVHLRVALRRGKGSNVAAYVRIHVLGSGTVISTVGACLYATEETASIFWQMLVLLIFLTDVQFYLEPADDKKEGDDSVLIETPVLMSIRRSRGPWSDVSSCVLSNSASSGWTMSKRERPSKS